MSLHPRRPAALLGVLCGLFVALIPAAPASAHATLVRTTPPAGTIVNTAPLEVLLTFSEPVSVVPGKIRVVGPDGERADRGEPVQRGGLVSVPLRGDGPRGTYLVSYRVLSADSHPVGGGFTFSVGAPTTTPTDSGATGETDPAVRALIPVTKYLGYAGLVLAAGPTLVLLALWPQRLSRRGPRRLVWLGLGLIGLGTVTGLVLQAPYTTGAPLTGITADDLREVLSSNLGTAYLMRLAILGAAALLLRPVLGGRGGTADRALLAILAVAGFSTWSLSGHPAASPLPVVTVVADTAHVAGMAVWLGGLLMLFGFLLRQAADNELTAILPIWSRWATAAVSTLLLAGTLNALVEVQSPKALVTTTYGWLVLAKVGLFTAVIAVAAMSRRLVSSAAAAGAPGRLRRLVAAELSVAAVVLAIAAVLVQTTPARTAVGEVEAAQTTGFSTTLTDKLFSLQVDVTPAKTGNNSLHLYAYTPDNRPQPVVEWKATAALAAQGVEPINIPLLRITENHAIGDVTLPTPGAWELRFTLRISEIDQATLSTTVTIT